MPEKSGFWPNGPPRENSTGIETCPPVARTFPRLDKENWQRFKDQLPECEFLKGTYQQWLEFMEEEQKRQSLPLMPSVSVDVTFDGCKFWCESPGRNLDRRALCKHANQEFDRRVRELIAGARSRSDTKLVLPEYIYLVTEEIGQDRANDISSIYHVRESASGPVEEPLVENVALFFEHALTVACAYAFKLGVHAVLYDKDETYVWK
jgi:hypothetical protein